MNHLTLATARDAWRRWRADRDTILAIVGVFLFLPMLAWLLLVPEPVAPDGATREQATQIVLGWAGANLHWLALRIGFELFASVALLSLYLARDHRDVAGLLNRSLRALPLFVVAVTMSWGLVTLGAFAFVIPGLYVYGRVALTGAVLIAEPEAGTAGAIARSVALTNGNGWRVFALLVLPLAAGLFVLQLIGGVDAALQAGGAAGPFAKAVVDILAALVATASGLARVLLQVALYRQLAAPRHAV